MPLRGLPGFIVVGIIAAFLQVIFLFHFAASLAETLHEMFAASREEEETAYWAAYLATALYGGSFGVVFHFVTRRIEPFRASLLFFVGYSLLPALKWLPTPHGVSYLEPVWWREAVYALYLLYNMALLSALALLRPLPLKAAAIVAVVVGFVAFPNFTLPERYYEIVPHLKALQGLALASWGLFWLVMALGARALMPIKKL
jgi:hypothetical protein